jgi:hypothetical protein
MNELMGWAVTVHDDNLNDKTIMSPFINQWPFYPQTSLEKLPRTAPPLTEIPML